jgi:hypothetical protein
VGDDVMTRTITDEQGEWIDENGFRYLISPSQSYIESRTVMVEEQLKLSSLTPSPEEVLKAEFEVKMLTLLQEVGLV